MADPKSRIDLLTSALQLAILALGGGLFTFFTPDNPNLSTAFVVVGLIFACAVFLVIRSHRWRVFVCGVVAVVAAWGFLEVDARTVDRFKIQTPQGSTDVVVQGGFYSPPGRSRSDILKGTPGDSWEDRALKVYGPGEIAWARRVTWITFGLLVMLVGAIALWLVEHLVRWVRAHPHSPNSPTR